MGRVLDFLFPLECIACGAHGAHCCFVCLAGVSLTPRFFASDGVQCAAAFAYGQPIVRQLLHDMKFEGWTCAFPALEILVRRWAVKAGGGFCLPDTVIVPVPLHAHRLRQRGFNQAAALARPLAHGLHLDMREDLLVRTRRTHLQTASPDREANVHGAFVARLSKRLHNRTILLVDDVWTTGATMRACAEALRSAGAGDIKGFALAWGSGDTNEKTKRVPRLGSAI